MVVLNENIVINAAKLEDASVEHIKQGLASGEVVIPKNRKHDISKACAIGKGMRTKVNANLGLSKGNSSISNELKKMEVAISAGADAVMDLSTGDELMNLRSAILKECDVPLGTVPIYELACISDKDFLKLTEDDFVAIIQRQAEEGVDFFTIHAGLTIKATEYAAKDPRVINIVSRGGALLASWMIHNKKENPFLSRFDDILRISKEYDVTLSLGDSLRPGAIADATDRLQVEELLMLGELQQRSFSSGVQVMIEGPGHVPLDQIEANIKLEKSICKGAPFYVLGPLVTDAAPGYDHIVSAIGGAVAGSYGADFLCYVTPAEHLRLPDIEDVRQGVIASKIAAHAADIAKGLPSAIKRDLAISKARAKRDWETQFELALDPDLPRKVRESSHPDKEDVCTMCSNFCSIKITEESFKNI